MKTIRRLFYADIVSAVAFVALAFLSLSFFIDFVDQLTEVGTKGYTVLHAALYALLLVPGRFYEVSPIAVLIGTIYTLSRMAQSSEFTILRTAGLGPTRALVLLSSLGLLFGVMTYVVGEYVAPLSERQAGQLRALFQGNLKVGRSGAGAWLKDHASTPEGERSYKINVGSSGPRAVLNDVRIYEFGAGGRLLRHITADSAQIQSNATWALKNVSITHWTATAGTAQAAQEKLAAYLWPSKLSASVVAAEVLPVATMSTLDLYRFIDLLADNEQAAQRHKIQFWKRALYPFACIVMVALALPFAYLHARAGGISLKVFGGIMLGISFVLLNNVAGHIGLLRNWTPWIVAATPSAFYLLLSLAAFSWLVRYR